MAIFGFALFLIAFLNTVLLAFAYRDLSLGLLAMAVLSVVGLPLATYLIMNRTNKKPLHWFVSEDETGNGSFDNPFCKIQDAIDVSTDNWGFEIYWELCDIIVERAFAKYLKLFQNIKRKQEANLEKNGYHLKEIFLCPYFLKLEGIYQ